MKNMGWLLVFVAFVFLIGGLVFASTAANKYTQYSKGNTSYYSRSENAYVGGDAYNYIINGTYFTAFAVASGACVISSILSMVGGAILIGLDKQSEDVKKHFDDIKETLLS